jgi:hypothetical protein
VIRTVFPSGAARAAASVPMTEPHLGGSRHHQRPLRATDLIRQPPGQRVRDATCRKRDDDFDGPCCLRPEPARLTPEGGAASRTGQSADGAARQRQACGTWDRD